MPMLRFEGEKAYLDGKRCHHPQYLQDIFEKTKRLSQKEYEFVKILEKYQEPFVKIFLAPFITLRVMNVTRKIKCYNHCRGEHESALCTVSLKGKSYLTSFYCPYVDGNKVIAPPLPNFYIKLDPITTLFLRCHLCKDDPDLKPFLLQNAYAIADWLDHFIHTDLKYPDTDENRIDPFIALGAFIQVGGAPLTTIFILSKTKWLSKYLSDMPEIKYLFSTTPNFWSQKP